MHRLLIATNNQGKITEIKAILAETGFTLVTPVEIGLDLEVTEDGQTYEDNASKKAAAFSQACQMVALADDSGLEVDALDGRPGLHSHRFCPIPNATDADRRKYLLWKLQGAAHPWTARFRATVAIAQPSGLIQTATGLCEGEIITEERGHNGFGYDPIFYIPDLGSTMAELEMEEKNRLSHRGRAVYTAIPILETIFRD